MSLRHILVVEDDQTLREGLVRALEGAGYRTSSAVRGQDALATIRESPPDLVVLDLMLPGMDGLFVLDKARAEGFAGPVIILSARGGKEDKLKGLEIGADDYVTKPFDLDELLARIAVRFRRHDAASEVRFGNIIVDRDARKAFRGGELVHLTPKEFDLLQLFLDHPRTALSRGRILEGVWGPGYEGTRRTVDNFVRALRAKLEDDPEQPRHFKTVWARGYAFEPTSAK
jgi:DNA-binding response OmpR family regulator